MFEQLNEPLVNYLRIHRRKAGLSQPELAWVLGYSDEGALAKHERFQSLPPFLIALGYEVIFQVPVSELFPGLLQSVAFGIEERLAEFESRLREQSATGPSAAWTARKLEWMNERRFPNTTLPANS